MNYFIEKNGLEEFGKDKIRKVPMNPANLVKHSQYQYDTDNSIGVDINFNDFEEIFPLEVGDCIFAEIMPDDTLYRGLWALSGDSLGYKFDIELVDAIDVWAAHCLGNEVCEVPKSGATLAFDMGECIGDATSVALSESETCAGWLENRNVNALQSKIFPIAAQFIAGANHAQYIRLKVTEVPADDEDDCDRCGLPCIQIGAVVDKLCVKSDLISNKCRVCQQSTCQDEDCNDKC